MKNITLPIGNTTQNNNPKIINQKKLTHTAPKSKLYESCFPNTEVPNREAPQPVSKARKSLNTVNKSELPVGHLKPSWNSARYIDQINQGINIEDSTLIGPSLFNINNEKLKLPESHKRKDSLNVCSNILAIAFLMNYKKNGFYFIM